MNPPGPFRWSAGRRAARAYRHLQASIRHHMQLHVACVMLIYFILKVFCHRRAARAGVKEPRRLIKLGLRLFVCMRFQVYCTPLPGFFSPFPHGTGSLSVDHEYLALEDGPPIFRQDYTCPVLLVVPSVPLPTFRVRGFHPLWPPFPERFAKSKAKRYRLLPFRSPLLWESRLISVPAVTEMFQFSAFAPAAL
jgi:hypothetical protein